MPALHPSLLIRVLSTSAAALGLGLICVLVVLLLRRLFYVEHKREHTIQLTNKGNARSTYQLALETAQPTAKKLPIKYQLLQNGIPLAELPAVPQSIPQAGHSAAGGASAAKDLPAAKQTDKSSRPAQPGTQPGANAKKAAESVKNTGKNVAAASGQAASVLGIIGSLLPGDLGKSLKAQGEAARGVQTRANETMHMPDSAMRKVDALQKEGGKLSGKAEAQAPQMRPASPKPSTTAAAKGAVTASTVTAAPAPQPVQIEAQPVSVPRYDYYAQTGEVAPGETLTLTLRILWKQLRTPESSQVYILHSQQVPVEKVSRAPIAPLSRQGRVYFAPPAPWRYWLPSFLYGFVSLCGLLAFVGLCIAIW